MKIIFIYVKNVNFHQIICSHKVQQCINIKQNLNSFVSSETTSNNFVFCKVCGEFLWTTEFKDVTEERRMAESFFDTSEGDIGAKIYKELVNYFIPNKIIVIKKK